MIRSAITVVSLLVKFHKTGNVLIPDFVLFTLVFLLINATDGSNVELLSSCSLIFSWVYLEYNFLCMMSVYLYFQNYMLYQMNEFVDLPSTIYESSQI